MPSLSEQVAGLEKQLSALEQQRTTLQKQMEHVLSRLTKIQTAFEGSAPKGDGTRVLAPAAKKSMAQVSRPQEARPTVAKTPAAKKAVAKTRPATPTKAKAKPVWFQPGEAFDLIRKTVKKPMKQRELVDALAEAKGYTGKLSKDQYKSFQGAAFVSIAQAVQARVLTKSADGEVSLRGE